MALPVLPRLLKDLQGVADLQVQHQPQHGNPRRDTRRPIPHNLRQHPPQVVGRQPWHRANQRVLRHLNLRRILGQRLHRPVRVVHASHGAQQHVHLPALDNVRGERRGDLCVPALNLLHEVASVRDHVPSAGCRPAQRRPGALLTGVGSQDLQDCRGGVHESQLRQNLQDNLLSSVQSHSEELLLSRPVPESSLAAESCQSGHLTLGTEIMMVPLMLRGLHGHQALQKFMEDLLALASQMHGKELSVENQQVAVLPLSQLHHALVLLRRLAVQIGINNFTEQVSAGAGGAVRAVALLPAKAVEDVRVVVFYNPRHPLLLGVEVLQDSFEQRGATLTVALLAHSPRLPHHPARRRPPGSFQAGDDSGRGLDLLLLRALVPNVFCRESGEQLHPPAEGVQAPTRVHLKRPQALVRALHQLLISRVLQRHKPRLVFLRFLQGTVR
mmetsp:Transcript_48801/g.106241  ORF Transcript_48801/g.106241 Transcript_48801/m.106241 type:complete len:442 (+) Transcript_48801:1639-2964(+)